MRCLLQLMSTVQSTRLYISSLVSFFAYMCFQAQVFVNVASVTKLDNWSQGNYVYNPFSATDSKVKMFKLPINASISLSNYIFPLGEIFNKNKTIKSRLSNIKVLYQLPAAGHLAYLFWVFQIFLFPVRTLGFFQLTDPNLLSPRFLPANLSSLEEHLKKFNNP